MENEFKRKPAHDINSIIARTINGEKVECPKCGYTLIFNDVNSGKHPGIFCPNNDFRIMMDFKKNNISE